MDPRDTQKTTRAIRPRGNLLRHLPKAVPQRIDERLADRPGKLNVLDVGADNLPVG